MMFDTPYHNWKEFVEMVVLPVHAPEVANPAYSLEEAKSMWSSASDEFKMACMMVAYFKCEALEEVRCG